MFDRYYKETTSYTDENGNEVEVNEVVYERSDGLGVDYVEQTKVNGCEVGHHTEHPDGTVHNYGIYADEEDDDEDEENDDEDNDNNKEDDEYNNEENDE